MELNSLLEVTEAINNNLPEESLYKIYDFTIRANLNIEKYALFVWEKEWRTKVLYGVSLPDNGQVPLPDELTELREITPLTEMAAPFNQFEVAIPILHKSQMLAMVLASGAGGKGGTLNTTFLQALSNLIIVAIENKRLARRRLQEEALRKELEIAKNVQNFLFPESLPAGSRLRAEASYLPHHSVGGDYYDYIPLDEERFLVCIADVSGKGIPAAIMMSNFQASLHTLLRHTTNLTEVVNALNYQIYQSSKGESFITFFVALYDFTTKELQYINAGHQPPLLFDATGRGHHLDSGTTVLGAFEVLPFVNEGHLSGLEAFTLFAYTDGLTETENERGNELGSDRVEAFLREHHQDDLEEVHRGLLEMADEFRGKQPYKDDITILSCRVNAK